MTADWQNAGFGVYIHWPFCAAKCPYCDFNSHVRTSVDQHRWANALTAEIARAAALTPGRTVSTVFFGGGTPSLMDPDTVGAVLGAIRDHWMLSPAAEITLEANPTSVEAGRFASYANLGVNRVSMGIQALNDKDLKALGRMHNVQEAKQAFEVAKESFEQVSFDLIYARQNQTLAQWRSELVEALDMAVDHLSLYQLTIEPGTRFGDLHARAGLRGLPGDALASDMYNMTQEVMDARGFPAYEISNHAAPGAQSRHNLIYWRYGDYAGIGPGAHGRLTLRSGRWATDTPLRPEDWLSCVESGRPATRMSEMIAPHDQASEYLMMSLRLSEGTSVSRINTLNKNALDMEKVVDSIGDGLLKREGDRITATRRGRLVLNRLVAELLAE